MPTLPGRMQLAGGRKSGRAILATPSQGRRVARAPESERRARIRQERQAITMSLHDRRARNLRVRPEGRSPCRTDAVVERRPTARLYTSVWKSRPKPEGSRCNERCL